MKKIFIILFLLASAFPSFAQIFEEKDSVQLENEIKDMINSMIVKEICGIEFGTSFYTAKQHLENKFGNSYFSEPNQVICFMNKKYAGIMFDSIIFMFQSDGSYSYMNGCVFLLYASSAKQAEKKEICYMINLNINII